MRLDEQELDYEPVQVRCAFTPAGRPGVFYTAGLEEYGLPELAIEPPPDLVLPPGLEVEELAMLFARVLLELGHDLIHWGECIDPVEASLPEDEVISFWPSPSIALGPVSELLARYGPIRQVLCSWWTPEPPG